MTHGSYSPQKQKNITSLSKLDRFLEQPGDVGLAIPASLHGWRQGSLLVRGWSNKKNQTLQENGREALEPSAAQERQLTLW